MHQKGCMAESGSESVSDKGSRSDSDSSGSASGSESDSGSTSSSSASGQRTESGRSSEHEEPNKNYENRSLSHKSEDNSSKSDNDSDSKGHSTDDKSQSQFNSKNTKLKSDIWEENPDIYGIRRSARSRKEPERLKIAESDSSDRGRNRKKSRRKSSSWNSNSSGSNSDVGSPPPPSKKPGQRSVPLRKKKPARRRNRFSSEDDESTEASDDDTKRPAASRRTGAAAVSYKEVSDEQTDSSDLLEVEGAEGEGDEAEAGEEDRSETIERVLAHRRGKKGVTGNVTTIYYIEENGDPNEGVDPNDDEATEPQYLIKWKGWAHIHNTWESEKSLIEQKVKGMKKLENFIKRDAELAWWKSTAGPEDIDYFECQSELQQDLVSTYNNVERIIATQTRDSEHGIVNEYFCKWESLPYCDATWEDAALIERRWPEKVENFKYREAAKTTPSRHSQVLRRRPKFHPVKEQPDYMGVDKGLVLRDYQMDGLNWLIHSWCKENSVILADEMGLGKTIQTICFLHYLFQTQSLHGPFLCVVPLSTMTAWQREFQQWAPDMNVVVYIGDVVSRDIIRQYEWSFASSKRLKFNAVLTTYEILLKDRQFLKSLGWACLLVDEAHRLKNDDSLLYKALKEFETNHRLLVTGTPLQNSLKELWALLHFIMPYKFDSWEIFEKEHENAATKGYEKLHKQLEPFILRRQKKDVEKSLPAKVEQILRVEMTSIQKQYYKWILTKNYSALRKGVKGSINTFINIVIELKKCCNHALLTKPVEYNDQIGDNEDEVQKLLRGSGKLLLLDKLLCRLKETGHRVLIFSQMVRMLDILAKYLQKRHFPFQRLDGSIKGEIRKQALDHFNAEGSTDFCFLLSTRAGGLGINLATADTVIIFDSDWNPQNDLQAQARAHRIGQKNQVNIYRLVTARSVEEDIVERAKRKMVLDHLVIQRMDTTGRTVLDKKDAGSGTGTNPFNKEDLNAILKFGAEELFKDDDDNDEEPVCDIDEILQRAETRDEGPAMVGDELLSAFKVASFAFDEEQAVMDSNKADPSPEEPKDWDDIIPENVRNAIAEEEKNKEMEDLYLPPRSRKTLQQNNEGRRGRKRGRSSGDAATGAEGDGDSEGSEAEASADEDRPKKRGRPPASHREKIKGFTDQEIRRFVKSYKKFSAPLKHLDSIACDAELQEKPLADLKKLGEVLQERCRAMLNDKTEKANDNTADGGRKNARKSFKLGGVPVNAKTLAACEAELAPLDDFLPDTKEERLKWQLDFRTRPANFDVEWTVAEDSKLLAGIYQYGMGSWEAIKMDSSLGIGDKILTNEDKKPQAKHLQSRAEYLLKLIKKLLDQKNGKQKQRKPRMKRGNKEPVTKDIVEEDVSSGEENKKNNKVGGKTEKEKDIKKGKIEEPVTHDETSNDIKKEKEKDKKKKKDTTKSNNKQSEKGKKKKPAGPMHFTANNEPRALEVLGDLDPSVFEECKEKMRPVKKALRALDNPDQTLSETEQVSRTRACLRQIGTQIDVCLNEYPDQETKAVWRSNLWYFVSKFTNFDAKQLYKLYKHGLKKSEESKDKTGKNNENSKNNKANDRNNAKENNHIKHGPKKENKKEESTVNKKDKKIKPDKDRTDNKIERERSHRSADRSQKSLDRSPHSSAGVKRKLEDGEYDAELNESKRHDRSKHRDRKRDRLLDRRERDRERSERGERGERSERGERERDRGERERDRRERERTRRDSGGTARPRPYSHLPHVEHAPHSGWVPPAYPGPRHYRADRNPRAHDKRRFPTAYGPSPAGPYPGGYYEGMGFPAVRPYVVEDWRQYGTASDYTYEERDYDQGVYRRDYDRRAPPT